MENKERMFEIEEQRQAVGKTLQFLRDNEPSCFPCENCRYGYKNDEESKNKCHELYQQTQKEKERWKEKIKYWEEKLKDLTNQLPTWKEENYDK